jgi:uncharacterized peroxidase-related enzyme
MPFIETVPEDAAVGAAAAMYDADREVFGYLPNFTLLFAERTEVYAAWRQLVGAIKANMDLRRFELATTAAASRMRSSYCTLAHGKILLDQFADVDTVRAVVDHDTAALDPVDAAVVELADKVTEDAASVTEADVDRLRSLGLSDAEILDVVLAAAVRCFFSRVLEGLGVDADAKFAELDPEVRDMLTVGRPIAAA